MVNNNQNYSPAAFNFPYFLLLKSSGVFKLATCTLNLKSENFNLFTIKKL